MDKTKIAASHHSLGNSKEWYEVVIDSITGLSAEEEENDSESTSPQLIHVYKSAISGFAAKLSTKELESLKKMTGFLSATPDEMLTLHTTRSPQFLGLELGKGLWNASNLESDVIIGVVDSGIWPEHISFQDEGMPPATKQLPLVYGRTAGDATAVFCIDGSLKRKLVKGKIVVCQRGITSRAEKGEQVKLAGGAGMLLVNTENEGEELFADAHILPATALGALAGKAIKKYLNSTTKPTASITFKGTVYGNPAPMMAAFSSRGPNDVGPDLIKPDVTAPGMNILAAWPPLLSPTQLESDKRSVLFNVVSGTSMSCPHVSGIAALIKSVHKDWSPAAIKSALMTTAYVLDNTHGGILDVASSNPTVATPFAFGSGHVDPEKASDPGLIYDITPEDYLNYLCSLKYSASQIALFAGQGFTCPKNPTMQPEDLNYASFAVNFKPNSKSNTITFTRTVTHVGIPNVTFVVQRNEPNGVSMTIEPEILKFGKPGQKLSYKITFTQKKGTTPREPSFGFIDWVYLQKYHVRSPIAVTWT
ncbi:hypothetical protein QUC31_005404 [Theobroma cacao]